VAYRVYLDMQGVDPPRIQPQLDRVIAKAKLE
jgi:hypothetical protein